MLITHIPMVEYQTAVYSLLTSKQTTPVYDDVGSDTGAVTYPCVSFGAYRCQPAGSKDAVIFDVTLALEIWSLYEGKKEINEVANDLAAAYTSWPVTLSTGGFVVLDQGIEDLEAFPEAERGYHGTLTITAKIQYTGQIGG